MTFLFEPHQLRGIVVQHHFDFVRLDPECEQSSNEDPHSDDAVHVQDLAEVASDDAAVGADFLDGLDGLHRVGNRLEQARDHRLAVGSDSIGVN